MPYPYSSSHFSSSPSLPGAWSSAWSLPQQYREYDMGQKASEIAEIKRVGDDDNESLLSSNSIDLDCPEHADTASLSNRTPMLRSKADLQGPLPASCHQENSKFQSLKSQSTLASSQDDAISDCDTFPGEDSPSYSCPSFCSSHRLTPLAFESKVSLETLSFGRTSVSNSPLTSPNSISSRNSLFSSEPGDINNETIDSCSALRKLTGIARPGFDNDALLGNLDTLLDNPHKTNFLEHIPRDSDTGPNYSSDFYPHPLLLSQPDGNNAWTLSLDPINSRPETISESSLELESLSLHSSSASDHDDEAIARIRDTPPSIYSTPPHDSSFLSLPPLQVGAHDVAEFSAASDVSVTVSSTSSVQQRYGEGNISVPFSVGNADMYDFPLLQDSALDPQQPSRSKMLVKKSKGIFGRLKRLFTPKGTMSEDMQAHTTHSPKSVAAKSLSNPVNSNAQGDTLPPASGRRFLPSLPWSSYQRYRLPRSSTPSFAQSFSPEAIGHTDNNIDEKYTYEYHARPKTLKEIKSQRRFSLPMGFVGTSSRSTSSTKRNIMTPVPRSQSRPMSMYIAPQSEILASAS